MLLYSTILDIKDTLTPEAFLNLVAEWNQNNPYEENIVPEFQTWDGSRNQRYGTDSLWIDIEEYRNQNCIAVRYEKVEPNGVRWDTDYVVNFQDQKIAIQLNRSYQPGMDLENEEFSAPLFISSLIRHQYLQDDHGLVIDKHPHELTEENLNLLEQLLHQTSEFSFPVIYVSKTRENSDPIDADQLSHKVKGLAHVFVESDVKLNSAIQTIDPNFKAYEGNICVFLPSHQTRIFYHRGYYHGKPLLFTQELNFVYEKACEATIPEFYTWETVLNGISQARLLSQQEKKKAAEAKAQSNEEELYKLIDELDAELEQAKKQIQELSNTVQALKQENQGLRAKFSQSNNPVLYFGEEQELYPDEIKEMIIDALKDKLSNTSSHTRYADVLTDIIQHNATHGVRKKRQEQIRALLKDYSTMSAKLRKQLEKFGFTITSDGKHYKLTYFSDSRYMTMLSKTGSDVREGRNAFAEIKKTML